MGLFDKFFKKNASEKEFLPPVPTWKPNTPIDYGRIIHTAKYYTGSKLQLGVFKNGTVTFFAQPVADIAEESKKVLNKIFYAHPDFKPLTMDDGNYLIEYTQPAFTIVFKDELTQYWDFIEENHQMGVCADEVLINGKGETNTFDEIGKICLFGRAKMFMDAQAPEIITTFDPQTVK